MHTVGDALAHDVAVIGGGASGLAAAITAARAGARVCMLERDVAAGLPILATGNGRCNISNAVLDTRHYRHPDIASEVFSTHPEQDIDAFFSSLGLMFAEEGEGRLYPVTRRAESVRDVLLAACARLGVEVRCCCEPVHAKRDGDAWSLAVNELAEPLSYKHGHDAKAELRRARKASAEAKRIDRTVRARSVIIACGGTAGDVCDLFDVPHLDETPILCPIACEFAHPNAPALDALDGLRVEANLTLVRAGEAMASEQGEVLFRSYGISGIAAFNLSRRLEAGDSIRLDLFPSLDDRELCRLLVDRSEQLGPFTGDPAWLDGMLARPLAQVICTLLKNEADTLTALAELLHRLTLQVTGTTEHAQAQVTRGGIPFDAIDLTALSLQRSEALYACGEALDMDADCGGYNLAWAWLSGMRAGTSAAERNV